MDAADSNPQPVDRPVTDGTVADRGQLFASLSRELRRLAAHIGKAGHGDTLQPTALVNEAFLKLCQHSGAEWNDRDHVVRVAACAMRQIVIDHKRERSRLKRGGDARHEPFDEIVHQLEERSGGDLLHLNEALTQLGEHDRVSAELVTLRFFGGRTVAETASIIGMPLRTTEQRLAFAKSWLRKRLEA